MAGSLGLRRGRRGRIAPLSHELVELGLVLGHAQALQEFTEFALLLFQPLQRIGTVFIESAVAARRPGPAAMTEALHLGAPPLPLFLPTLALMSAPPPHPPPPP